MSRYVVLAIAILAIGFDDALAATPTPTPTVTATFTMTCRCYIRVNIAVYDETGEVVSVIASDLAYEDRIAGFSYLNGIDTIDDDHAQIVIILSNGSQYAWHGKDENGRQLPNGTYLIVIESTDPMGVVVTVTHHAYIVKTPPLGAPEDKIVVSNSMIDPTHGEKMVVHVRLDRPGKVKVSIYDRRGNLIRVLVDEAKQADFGVVWNGINAGGSVVPSGIYVVTVETSTFTETRKIVVMK